MRDRRDVIPPDEYARGDDSPYTNLVARIALRAAAAAARRLNRTANLMWETTASQLPILFDASRQYHPEYVGYAGQLIKQADVVMLSYPLMLPMDAEVRRSDLGFYAGVTDVDGPAMTWAIHAIGYLENGDVAVAAPLFNRSFANVQPPFGVWTETPTGGATNFITGAGGFLQAVLNGYGGLRIFDRSIRLRPYLIEGTTAVRLRGLRYRGVTFDVITDARQMVVALTARESALLVLTLGVPVRKGTPTNESAQRMIKLGGTATLSTADLREVHLIVSRM
mmetsp:Transcript_17310/g.51772  ORF Transcript_17310/g.51772 Transcript_17310/m.51772 type:complete len:280 (+) Transcript_17310:63-902(+)